MLGLRFAPMLCFAGIALGVASASPVLLFGMAATAFVGGFGDGHGDEPVPSFADPRPHGTGVEAARPSRFEQRQLTKARQEGAVQWQMEIE